MDRKQEFLALATEKFGAEAFFKNSELIEFANSTDFERKDWNWLFAKEFKVARGQYQLPPLEKRAKQSTQSQPQEEQVTQVNMSQTNTPVSAFNPNAVNEFNHVAIPDRDRHYVPFGDFKLIEQIIRSGEFFPAFIFGHSGNGKTFMVEQACARAKRPMVRVQMSRETDESDLIGAYCLIQGETKFMKGPVLRAMETGALLLIDEADRADPGKVMCLQGILEGKPYFSKKTGEIVKPAHGFNVIVTANTQGKGSDDGRYAASILDDAWLERFPITIAQEYPAAGVETRILNSYLKDGENDISDNDKAFVKLLISWADIIRKTFDEQGIDEMISTRRLVHIIKTYRMFDNDRMQAVRLCTNRFDPETRNSFLELYNKVDPDNQEEQDPEKDSEEEEDFPF